MRAPKGITTGITTINRSLRNEYIVDQSSALQSIMQLLICIDDFRVLGTQ